MAAVGVEHLDQHRQPLVAGLVSGLRRDRAEVAGVAVAERELGDRLPGGLAGGDDLSAAEARQVEGLRGRDERDPALGRGLADRDERDVLGARQGHRGVDLVGEDPGVVLGGDLGEALELGPGDGPAGRIVRVAEEQRPGAGGEGALDPVEVEVAAIGERHLDQLAAGLWDRG